MRSLLAMLLLSVLCVPALAVDPPDYLDIENQVTIYDEDGAAIVRYDRAFLIEQDGAGNFVGTVQQTVNKWIDGELVPTIVTHTYKLGGSAGIELANTLSSLNAAVGEVRRLRCFVVCLPAKVPPLSSENISFVITKVLPEEE